MGMTYHLAGCCSPIKGDQIVGIVTDKYEAEGEGCVECDLYLEKEDGDRLVGGQAILVLPFESERT